MKVLLTGAAGFIGMHCVERIAARGDAVTGIDNLSPYYSVELKQARLERLRAHRTFRFERLDLADAGALEALFAAAKPDLVLHLAAQPGVRYSLENPGSYVAANLVGFANLLECCRRHAPRHLVYASSSSVYGGNTKLPWSESDNVDHPVSLYAATKKSNELLAHVYSHLFGLPTTGLRYFTVYGPWGRPDMSPMLFARAIMDGQPIDVFNQGDMQRDFTFIDDVVEATLRVLDEPASPDAAFDSAAPDPATSRAPWRVYNIGNHQPVPLLDYIAALERALGRTAIKRMQPMQPGDVQATYAETTRLADAVGFAPSTALQDGLEKFARWFKSHYGYA
ncbi:MAG: NAD-dependent epimerase [Betaproteobacteria bacterium]|nr:MAG: NAD-dependent epimerase [Betaproteobacteria bacterium]